MKTKRNTSSGKRTTIAPSGIVLFIMILFLILGGQKSFAQGVGISEVSISPDASSILELRSTLRGLLAPRMTTAERNAILSPATGLLIYNTTTNAFNYYNGTGWIAILNIGTGVTSVSGTLNRISIGGTPTVPVIDIDAGYIGQTSITTLGTINTGTWNGTAIGVTYGGTGLTTFGGANTVLYTTAANALNSVAASTAAGQFLQTTASGGVPSWKTILAVANGGTGSATQNFVDLTTAQTIGGNKTFTGTISGSNLSGTNTGDQTITLTGDVSGSGTGSFAATITNNAVTYAKMQAVGNTSRLLGSSSTTTPVQEISLGSGLSLTGTTLSAAGSGGTVTNFSAGDLSPLFTTTEATTTTTPALSFSFTNAGAYTVFGNNTAIASAPAYFTPVLASALFQNQGTVAGVLHGNAAGNPSWGQIVNADITNSTINLTQKVTGTLPIANGGTNSSTALSGSSIMVSNGTSIVQGSAGTATTVLHGNAAGVPTYSAIGLTTDVSGTLSVANGGTGLTTFGGANTVLYTTAANALNSVAASTAAGQFLQTTASGGVPSWKTILAVANGGTGSATQNFVDLTTAQTIGGNKTFTGTISGSNLSGTNTGDQTITLTGDVSGSGTGSFAATITNNAVTYAKMQAVGNTSRLLGSSSTTTPVQEISLGSGLSLTGTTLSAAGSGGTVTNFSAGDLSPLFTTTEATTTTTPALSFSFTNAGAYTVFGNNTAIASAPAYFTPVLASALFQNQGTVAGVLHGNAAGNPSWGQIVNADITNSTINLTQKVTGTLPIANGGTNSSTALSGSSIMVSNGTSIVQGSAGTATTVLHGNAAGVPTYSAIGLTTDVSGTLSVANGGTGLTTFGGANTVLYTTAANALNSVAASTAAGQFLQTTASGGVPSWKTTLAVANGGTNSSTALSGSTIMVSNGTSIVQGLPGTATTVLHGNAAGAPTYSAIGLTTDVSGTLPIANGGTNNGSISITDGGVVYTDGTKFDNTGAGTAGQVLTSNGAAAPNWAYPNLTTVEDYLVNDVTLAANTYSAALVSVTLAAGTWLITSETTVNATAATGIYQNVTVVLGTAANTAYTSGAASSRNRTTTPASVTISLSKIITLASSATVSTYAASDLNNSVVVSTPSINGSTIDTATAIHAIRIK